MARKRNTPKKTSTASTSRFTTVKTETKTIIHAVQYGNFGFVTAAAPAGFTPAKRRRYGGQENDGNLRNRDYLKDARIYRIGPDQALIQFSCGDYVIFSIKKMEKVLGEVKTFSLTKQPEQRNKNSRY
jgi:hypothetical protein